MILQKIKSHFQKPPDEVDHYKAQNLTKRIMDSSRDERIRRIGELNLDTESIMFNEILEWPLTDGSSFMISLESVYDIVYGHTLFQFQLANSRSNDFLL